MPICKKCKKSFPNKTTINNKECSLHHRSYCLDCSPYKSKTGYNLRKSRNKTQNKTCPICKRLFPYSKNNLCSSCRTLFQRNRKKEKLIKQLGDKCSRCGYNKCIKALEFHHIDPNNKSFNISGSLHLSMEILSSEVKKCVLLCSNCHREIHYLEHEQRCVDIEKYLKNSNKINQYL